MDDPEPLNSGRRRAALIGNPVDHSRSPAMHNAAFVALGIPATYELWHTEPDELAARFAQIRDEDILGVNVTVPYKLDVMPFCDRITETAARVGAVNTIIPHDGILIGDNTDAYGFATSVRKTVGELVAERGVVLGAGGASRAIVVALHDLGVRTIVIANRTRSRAEEIAESLAEQGIEGVSAIAMDDLDVSAVVGTGIVVNATSVGWRDDAIPLDRSLVVALPAGALVADLTYRETALLRAASARGLATIDGYGMLLHQGVRAFELWTGIAPPVEVMRAAMLAG
ncbi:MAG: shikimate dehydrogenase [Thermomicrobiales bacterium]